MKKKISAIIVTIILLSNLISNISCAITVDDISNVTPEEKSFFNLNEILDSLNQGQTKVTNGDGASIIVKSILNTTGIGAGATITVHGINFVLTIGNIILTQSLEMVEGRNDIDTFTIYDTVMGNYTIFNFDYISPDTGRASAFVNKIKKNVKGMYYFSFSLSIAASLFVLIYIGIRMAISTVAAKKAKYKSMLTSWVVALCLVFVMHFIIMALSYISITALRIVREFADNVRVGGANSLHISEIELGIIKGLYKDLSGKTGFNVIVTVLTIGYLVYIQFKFFVLYTRRFFEITILTIIGPLVTVTYPIDKAGDNKAQAFQAWITELIIKVSIQIVHAIVYILFIVSAYAIAQKAPLIALVFFSGLTRGERIFRNLLNVKDNGLEDVKLPIIE